jgi:hypothetical protein
MHCVICNQQLRAYWTDLYGGHRNNQWYFQQLQNEVISVIQEAGLVEIFFQQDGAHPHTENVTLHVLHGVYGNHELLNKFLEHFKCGWSWSPCSLDMNACDYYLKDCLSLSLTHTRVQ